MDDFCPWDDELPDETAKIIPILTPRDGASVIGLLLSDLHVGCWTHFVARRTVPCSNHLSGCEHCERYRSNWKCYLPGWLPDVDRMFLVELTQQAVIDGTPKGLKMPVFRRGQRIRVFRTGISNHSRMQFKLSEPEGNGYILPPPFNVRNQLKRIWAGDGSWLRRQAEGNNG